MTRKRALMILVPVLVVIGWAVSMFLSIRQIGDSFPEARQLDSIAVETGTATARPTPTSVPEVRSSAFENLVQAGNAAEDFQVETPGAELAALSDTEDLGVFDPPLSVEERCVLMRDVNHWLFYGPGRIGSRAVEFYSSLPETELKARADIEDDGFAQYFFAQTQVHAYIIGRDRGDLSESSRDALVETIQEYFTKAIRKQIKGWGPYDLAWLSYTLGDRTEAAAWLTIDERMGGYGFEEFRLNALRVPDGFFILDPYDVSEGAKRAEELISEYDLAAGLLTPEECNGVVQ